MNLLNLRRASGTLLAAVLAIIASALPVSLSAVEHVDVIAPLGTVDNLNAVAPQPATVANYSAGVSDILKMIDAKVDPEVVKAFVRSSQASYNPTASEIIELKKAGVPDDILTAMLQRGAELRAQSSSPQTPSAPPYAPAPTYAQPPATAYYDNTAAPYAYDMSAYPYYPYYSYTYPYYAYWWNYGFGWPFYCPFFYGFNACGSHYHHYPYHGNWANNWHNGAHSQPWGSTSWHHSTASGQPWAAANTHTSARTGGSMSSASAFANRSFGTRSAGFQSRTAGFSSGSAPFMARSAGFSARSGSFGGGMHSGGGAMRSGGGFHGGAVSGGRGGGHR